MILRRLIFIALSAVIYVAPSAFAQAVRASYSGLSGQNLPFWLTYDAGLYKKYGLSTEIVLISGGLTNIQAVMANEIAFTYLGGASPIQATAQGADIVVLATAYGLMPYGMIGNKNVHTAAAKRLWSRGSAGSRRRPHGSHSTGWAWARAMCLSCKRDPTRCASRRWNQAQRKRRCSRPRAVRRDRARA